MVLNSCVSSVGRPFLALALETKASLEPKAASVPGRSLGLRAEDAAEHSRLVRGLWGAVQLCGDLHFAGF